jgi:phage regulator Rha-like protein
MADLEIFDDGNELYVDSRLIAERLGIEHRSFLETLDNYTTQIEQAFGVLRFETAKPQTPQGGRPLRYCLLSEDQSTFVMTLSRNSPEVVRCKLELVTAFSKAKKLLSQRGQSIQQVPYWYQRIRLALSDVEQPLQTGYFCTYQEMMRFFAELEGRIGYVVPDFNPEDGKYLVPDISVGRKFNEFLRSDNEAAILARQQFLGSGEIIDFRQGQKNHHEIQVYMHVYPTASHGRYQRQPANSYPTKYQSIFQYHLQEWWIPDSCIPYLKKRDPQGVKYIAAALNELPSNARVALSGTLLGKLMRSLPPSR